MGKLLFVYSYILEVVGAENYRNYAKMNARDKLPWVDLAWGICLFNAQISDLSTPHLHPPTPYPPTFSTVGGRYVSGRKTTGGRNLALGAKRCSRLFALDIFPWEITVSVCIMFWLFNIQPFIVFQFTEHKWMILKMKQTTGEITKSIKILRTVLWVADYTMQVVFKINTTRHKTSLCVQFSGKPIQQISVGGFVTSFQEAKTCKHFRGDKSEAVALAWPTMYW